MTVTEMTRRALHYRKTVKRWRMEGFEEVDEGGGMLWELHRGRRYDHIITAARIAPDGKSVFVKIERRCSP